MIDGKFRILSFRSKDPVFKPDPGVVPDQAICDKAGITVVNTGFQHTEMSDRGPDGVKESIASALDQFLDTEPARPTIRVRQAPAAMAQVK
jgi:hypothetical protein